MDPTSFQEMKELIREQEESEMQNFTVGTHVYTIDCKWGVIKEYRFTDAKTGVWYEVEYQDGTTALLNAERFRLRDEKGATWDKLNSYTLTDPYPTEQHQQTKE